MIIFEEHAVWNELPRTGGALCSRCDYDSQTRWPFCPMCGCFMDNAEFDNEIPRAIPDEDDEDRASRFEEDMAEYRRTVLGPQTWSLNHGGRCCL